MNMTTVFLSELVTIPNIKKKDMVTQETLAGLGGGGLVTNAGLNGGLANNSGLQGDGTAMEIPV